MRRFICGSMHNCSGSLSQTEIGSMRTHASREEAFKCKVHDLMSRGYIRVGKREFKDPNDGTILILSRITKFGGEMRGGKVEQSSKRTVFMKPGGGIIE